MIFSDSNGNILAKVTAKPGTSQSTIGNMIAKINEAVDECHLQFPYNSQSIDVVGCRGNY